MARPGQREQTRTPARRLTVRVEEIGSGGDGVARDGGGALYVPLTAPGDLAAVDVQGERGRIVELIEKSPLRADPSCRHFGDCGGCAFQHLDREEELRWKRSQVETALARAGVSAMVGPVMAAPAASRRRAAFAVKRSAEALTLGFNARRSARIVTIEDCAVLAPALASRLSGLRAVAGLIPAGAFDLAVTLCDNGLDLNISASKLTTRSVTETPNLAAALRTAGVARLSVNGDTALTFAEPVVAFDGVPVRPPPGAFLQASREGEAMLISLVKAAAGGARKIADLFAGCGTFSLPLAKAASITAFDNDRAAIDALARAAAAAQSGEWLLKPLRAEARDLFARPLTARELKPFDAVVFDPPRAGAAAQAAEIGKSAVACVIGVSCNPQSFARDAALLAAGGYELRKVTPVDQFVYSPHVELVGVFARR